MGARLAGFSQNFVDGGASGAQEELDDFFGAAAYGVGHRADNLPARGAGGNLAGVWPEEARIPAVSG